MSIAAKLQRLTTARGDISDAITQMGGTVNSGDGFEDFAADIATIPQGGGTSDLDDYISGSMTAITSNALSVKGHAFDGESTITSLSLPLAVSIGASACYRCISLAAVSAPEATIVDSNAFDGCTHLTTVFIPKATQCGSNAFNGCTVLASITFPELINVSYACFMNCTGLTVAELTKATVISDRGFRGCTQLNALVLRSSTLCSLSAVTGFYSTPFRTGTGGTVYVPQSLISSYQNATNWSALESVTFAAIEGSIYELTS